MGMKTSEQLRYQLTVMTRLFNEAVDQNNTPATISLEKSVRDLYARIDKACKDEGETLDRSQINEVVDRASKGFVAVARKFVPAEQFNDFIDEWMASIGSIWDGS